MRILTTLAMAAAAITLMTVSPALAAAEDVKCGKWLGSHGGERAYDNSGILTGPAERDAIYHCAAMYGTAEIKGYCAYVQYGEIGKDRCAL